MMTRLKTIIPVVVAIAALLALGYALWLGIRGFAVFLTSLDSTVAATLVAASATAVVSVLSVLISKHLERRAEIAGKLREQKVPAYQDLTSLAFDLLYGERIGRALTEQQMLERFALLTPQLVTWGDAGVIKSYATFRRVAVGSGGGVKVMFALEDVYRAIRRDLGHDDRYLAKGDILALFVNDIDKHL